MISTSGSIYWTNGRYGDKIIEGELNRRRELAGLTAAMDRWGIGRGAIITYNQEGELQIPGDRRVRLIPAWKWLTGTIPRD